MARLDADHARWRDLQTLGDDRVEHGELRLAAQQERLPQAEEVHAQAQDAVNVQRAALAQADQRLQVEQANRGHAQRALQIVAGRRERLTQERKALPQPDSAEYELKQETLADLRQRIVAAQADLATQQQELPRLEQERRAIMADVQHVQKERAEAHARRAALEQLQQRVQGDGKLGDWLQRHRLDQRLPLWKSLHVTAGWEDAVEAVLRERLNALPADHADPAWSRDRPGSKLTLLVPAATSVPPAHANCLLAHVRCDDTKLAAILADWLTNVLAVADLTTALVRREHLTAEQRFVTPDGDIVTRHDLTFFAPDAAEHGLLERQREIDELGGVIAQREERVEQEQVRLHAIEERSADAQSALQTLRKHLNDLQEQAHAIQVETLKLSQALDRWRERQGQIDAGLAEMASEEENENERLLLAETAIEAQREQMRDVQQLMDRARTRFEQTERALRDEREQINGVERELREAQFSQRECQGKLEAITRSRELAGQQLERIADELARCSESAAALQAEDLQPQLQQALAHHVARELAMAAARDALEAATTSLRELEEQRMRIEHSLDPWREQIGDLKLRQQAASLSVEQLATQLREAQADEQGLAAELAGARAGPLQNAIAGLQRTIDALGAVNLAALDELEAARERKGYLDAQSEDLTQAMETLENAIRRIDRETRDLLQSTFDAVNRSFGELFPTLFGGGEARLIMTGEEILDAGLQVMAQPPGKKNSTIHLLSGGEKALTAIALVFSMFQLNPAPFCLLDEVDAPLDDTNTERFCTMVRRMADNTQFLFIS
ncbi:MAG: chromosome segregation protein SMC, partial [Propionivibrio sp.]